MQNKHKKKQTLIKILAIAMIIFFNGVLFGNVVMAQEVQVDQACYEKYKKNSDNYGALGENCQLCFSNTDQAIKDVKAECTAARDKGYSDCDNFTYLSDVCSTLTGSKKQDCLDCDAIEPGPERENCEKNFNLSKIISDCKKKHTTTYDNCVSSATEDCGLCVIKLEPAAKGYCKDFTEFLDKTIKEVKATYGDKADETVKCVEDAHDNNISSCWTNDAAAISQCFDDALFEKKSSLVACEGPKTQGEAECTTKQEAFVDKLCGDFTGDEKNECLTRNTNSLLTNYGNCITSSTEVYTQCKSTAELTYTNATKICSDKDFSEIKDKQCFDNVVQSCLDKAAKPECGNKIVEEGEECDDGEGKGDDEDKYLDPNAKNKEFDSCFECKYVDVPYEFNVTKYLKIPEGQTYLEKSEEGDVNLKKGLVYFIITGIEFITRIISAFALLFVIAGGIILMVSHGNSSMQQKGKRMILYSVLGLAIALTSLIIVTFVQSLFYTT